MEKKKVLDFVHRVVEGPAVEPYQSDHYVKEHWLGHQVITGVMQADEAYDQLGLDDGKESPTV